MLNLKRKKQHTIDNIPILTEDAFDYSNDQDEYFNDDLRYLDIEYHIFLLEVNERYDN